MCFRIGNTYLALLSYVTVLGGHGPDRRASRHVLRLRFASYLLAFDLAINPTAAPQAPESIDSRRPQERKKSTLGELPQGGLMFQSLFEFLETLLLNPSLTMATIY